MTTHDPHGPVASVYDAMGDRPAARPLRPLLALIDQAFEAEIVRVSSVEYNSNAICRKFYEELRKRIEANYSTQSRPEAELPELPESLQWLIRAYERQAVIHGKTGENAIAVDESADQLRDGIRAYAESHAAYWKEMHRAANARGDGVEELREVLRRVRAMIIHSDAEYLSMDADGKVGLGEFIDNALNQSAPGSEVQT